ncbi:MAG: XkdQ/YqbQ family protein [Peptoanaerobacter stomatis]|uniref:XkdQ/YqbQ family protein n=1 Tax=Peptoanaerobacter stomatis TaxID=796937 RepID=UPI003FA004E4
MYKIYIENKRKIYDVEAEGNIVWTTEQKGSPGKLTFNVIKDKNLDFAEGNPVKFIKDGKNIFFGYVWDKSRDKEQIISVTCYDQLRYLKYKDTYVYKVKKASEVISMIAKDFNLKLGSIEDTSYVIEKRIRDNMTLFDIIYDALNLTFDNTKKLYTLYDEFGRLTLKNLESMRLNCIVDYDNASDFNYKTTLDDVYNKVKLVKENKDTKKRDVFIAQNSSKMNKWGVLQYFDKVNEKVNAKAKADALLNFYSSINRKLSISKAIGDIRVRGGSSVLINFKDIGDISIKNFMLVDKVVHTFSDNEHFMDLDVKGRM